MARDDHSLVDPLAELAHTLVGSLGGYALLVGAGRAVAEANRPEAVDADDDLLVETGEERAHLIRVPRLHPLLLLGPGDPFEHGAVGVAPDEACVEAPGELIRLLGQRAPGEVAAETTRSGCSRSISARTAASAGAFPCTSETTAMRFNAG